MSGFYYLQSRYYDPSIGRFINADAATLATMSAMDIEQTNLFQYCGNNPVSQSDETGSICLPAIIGGAVAGAVVGAGASIVNSLIAGEPIAAEAVLRSAAVGAIAGTMAAMLPAITTVFEASMVANPVLTARIVTALGVGGFVGVDTFISGGTTGAAILTGATAAVTAFTCSFIPGEIAGGVVTQTVYYTVTNMVGGAVFESWASVGRAVDSSLSSNSSHVQPSQKKPTGGLSSDFRGLDYWHKYYGDIWNHYVT